MGLRARTVAAIAALAFAVAALLSADARQRDVPRIVAIGDVHGHAQGLDAILRQASLMDAAGSWTGGRAILVQTGDITDRGAGVRAAFDRLMSLERQAERAGGRVHALLGNHEVMNLFGDMRDVSPDAFAAFADSRSEERRQRAHASYRRFLADAARSGGPSGLPSADEWLGAIPPGYLEYREAFGRDGRYGRWLRERDVVVQIGGVIFLHGGLHPETSPAKLSDINGQARREIRMWDDGMRTLTDRDLVLPFFTFPAVLEATAGELQRIAKLLDPEVLARQGPPPGVDQPLVERLQALGRISTWSVMSSDGPLWFRGLATWTEEAGAPLVSSLLAKYGATRIVIGHTVAESLRITPRFGGRVVQIDTGMLNGKFFPGGRPSALEIRDGTLTAIYLDGRTEPLTH